MNYQLYWNKEDDKQIKLNDQREFRIEAATTKKIYQTIFWIEFPETMVS